MNGFEHTVLSATTGTAATVSATKTGSEILTYVTLGITILSTVSNFLLDLYRKWRDRDEDKKPKKEQKKENGK